MKTFTQKTIGVLIGSLLILLSYSTRLQAQGGEALNLDGGNDYITTSSVAFGNNWSVEGWIKPSNTNGIYWNAVFGQIFYNNNQGFVVGVFANTVFLDGPLGLHIETGVTANVWAHIAVTCDNDSLPFIKTAC